jgi:hypothetical protein
MPDSTQLEEKFVSASALAYLVVKINNEERVQKYFFITYVMAK